MPFMFSNIELTLFLALSHLNLHNLDYLWNNIQDNYLDFEIIKEIEVSDDEFLK